MKLSEKLRTNLEDFIETSEKQERYIECLEATIQSLVYRCEEIYRFEPLGKVGKEIIEEMVEEYKEDI